MIVSIRPEEVLSFASNLIKAHASECLALTMHSSDDPLPEHYFALLGRKVEGGVRIRRIGFGDRQFFDVQREIHLSHANYSFRFSDNEYKRMLLLDQSRLLFKTSDGIRYTEDRDTITKYVRYFTDCWRE